MFMPLLLLQRPEQLLKRTQLMERWARWEVCLKIEISLLSISGKGEEENENSVYVCVCESEREGEGEGEGEEERERACNPHSKGNRWNG